MSKTYKDEPYWVKKNNTKKYDTYEKHHHGNFGRPAWETTRYRRVAKGPVQTRLYTVWVPVFASEYHKVDTAKLTLFLSHGGSSTLYYMKEERVARLQGTELIPVGTRSYNPATSCTIDAPDSERGHRRNLKYWVEYPCEHRIVWWQAGIYNRPDKTSAKLYHAGRRLRHRIESTKMAKLYNSGENLEDYDYEPLHQRTHEGWWD